MNKVSKAYTKNRVVYFNGWAISDEARTYDDAERICAIVNNALDLVNLSQKAIDESS